MPSSSPSKGGWVCFRTAECGSSRDGVYWHRLAIGGEKKKKKSSRRKANKLQILRWFSHDQYSDLKSAVVALDSYVYTLGGREHVGIFDYASSRVYRCNMNCVADDDLVWERCASMLVARKSPRAVVVAGKIFVVGGYALEHWRTIGTGKWVEVFDPAKGTWEFLPNPVLSGQRVSLYKLLDPSYSSRGGGGAIDYSDGCFPISVVVCGSDQILFSSKRSSYLYNVHNHSLRESPYRVVPRSLFLPPPNLFDHKARVEYSFDWEDGSLYGDTMCEAEEEEEDPSTIRVCRKSFFEGTLFSPDEPHQPPSGSGILASFSGHGGVFNGRLHAHVLLLEYGDRRHDLKTYTACYRHLVYSDSGYSDDGDLLLRRRIKTNLRFLLDSHEFLIDAVIMGGKNEGSDKRRRLGTEKHKVLVGKKRERSSGSSSGRKRKRGRKDEGSDGIGDMGTVTSVYGEKWKRHGLCRKCRSQY